MFSFGSRNDPAKFQNSTQKWNAQAWISSTTIEHRLLVHILYNGTMCALPYHSYARDLADTSLVNCILIRRQIITYKYFRHKKNWKRWLKSTHVASRHILCSNPVNMPAWTSTGPVLVRCWQHWPSTGPELAHYGMFRGTGITDCVGYIFMNPLLQFH